MHILHEYETDFVLKGEPDLKWKKAFVSLLTSRLTRCLLSYYTLRYYVRLVCDINFMEFEHYVVVY